MASVPNSGSAAPPPPIWDARPVGPEHVAYGGFWIRVVAYIIDGILLTIVCGVVDRLLGINILATDWDHYDPLANVISLVIGWLYFALLESSERGATVGKMLVRRGMPGMKGGVGSASTRLGDVVIAALVVVNASGDIVDWRQGTIVAGARTADGRGFARTVEVLRRDLESPRAVRAPLADDPLRATTLAVVATNVALTKTQLTKLAMMANTGASRAINPYHTQSDGDQVLAVSTGLSNVAVSLTALGAIAAEVLADAIVRAVRTATGVPGWKAVRDL